MSLTIEQQSALVAALELGSEVPEIGIGDWMHDASGWGRLRYDVQDDGRWVASIAGVEYATQEHYDAACYRVARWLKDKHGWIPYRSKITDSWFRLHLDGESLKIDCPDDELTAHVAAAREVGK